MLKQFGVVVVLTVGGSLPPAYMVALVLPNPVVAPPVVALTLATGVGK